MSHNKLSYDKCAYATQVKESTSPLEYVLYKGQFENCTPCSKKDSDTTNNLNQVQVVNVENELFNLAKPASLCPSQKYQPGEVDVPKYSPPQLCQSIHYLAPSGLEKKYSKGFDDSKLGLNFCSNK